MVWFGACALLFSILYIDGRDNTLREVMVLAGRIDGGSNFIEVASFLCQATCVCVARFRLVNGREEVPFGNAEKRFT